MNRLGPRIAEVATRAFAWAGKGLGLVSAFDQLILHSTHPSGVALAFSACLIAGAQSFEGIALHFIDNLFDIGGAEPPDRPSRHTSKRKPKEG